MGNTCCTAHPEDPKATQELTSGDKIKLKASSVVQAPSYVEQAANTDDFEKHRAALEAMAEVVTKEGDRFKGQYDPNHGKRGFGILTAKKGTVIEGCWVNDLLEGKAKVRYVNGDFFEGTIKNGKANGYGVFSSKSGTK